MSQILISNQRHIRRINKYGNAKMIRNVMSLQQNLTNIASVDEKSLDISRAYYEMFYLGGEVCYVISIYFHFCGGYFLTRI